MDMLETTLRTMGALKSQAMRLLFDRRGVAAIEFAFIAPLLLMLYFVTMEVAQGIESNKKVGRVASMVADLVTQQEKVNASALDAIMKIGGAIVQPYNRTSPKIVITAIEITSDSTPQVKVAWSRKMVNGASSQDAAPGTTTTVPAALKIGGTFLVRVETYLDYRPVITWTASQKQALGLAAAFDNINMKETYYLRPRMSTEILCGDC